MVEAQRRIEAWRNGVTVEVKCEIGSFGVVGYETQLECGNVLIQQEVLLPEKFNLSLRLGLLLLDRLKGGITSTNKTAYAMRLRN